MASKSDQCAVSALEKVPYHCYSEPNFSANITR